MGLAAVVLVCEMAGSYELLVPLMLAEAIAVIALREVWLYPSQIRTVRESPAIVKLVSVGPPG